MFDWVLNTPLSVRGEDSATLRKKCLNTGFFLVSIFPYSDRILRFTTLISVFSSNMGKYGTEKTRTLFTQCQWYQKLIGNIEVHQGDHGCLLVELTFLSFNFSIEQRGWYKFCLTKNQIILERFNALKNTNIFIGIN